MGNWIPMFHPNWEFFGIWCVINEEESLFFGISNWSLAGFLCPSGWSHTNVPRNNKLDIAFCFVLFLRGNKIRMEYVCWWRGCEELKGRNEHIYDYYTRYTYMTNLKSLEDKHLNKNKIESNKPNQEGERPYNGDFYLWRRKTVEVRKTSYAKGLVDSVEKWPSYQKYFTDSMHFHWNSLWYSSQN